MDLESKKFGKGPKELTGAVDLINHYKLFSYYKFFCKKSIPSSISDTHYIRNVVGDTEIRKGEGMQLNQLIKNSSFSRETNTRIKPFDLIALRDAFSLKETGQRVDLPASEKGVPTKAGKSRNELNDKEKKHKKHKEKNKEHKKHKHHHKDRSKDKEKEKKTDKISYHDSLAENLKKAHEKKRKYNEHEELNAILMHKNNKHKSSKMNEFGAIRIAV